MSKKSFGLKNFFFSFAIVCIVLYVFQNYINSIQVEVVEKGKLEDIIKSKAVLVKDEKLFTAGSNGSVTFYRKEGEKISSGVLIADLNTSDDSVSVKNQITEIDIAIASKQNSPKQNQQAVQMTEADLAAYESNLQNLILNNDYDGVYQITANAQDGSSYQYDTSDKYTNKSIVELEALKAGLVKSLDTNKIPYYAPISGFLSYKIDGLENMYKYDEVLELTPTNVSYPEYTISDNSLKTNLVANDGMFKVVSSFDYYLVVKLNNQEAKYFKENTYIKTRVKVEQEEQVLFGLLKKINYGSEESNLVIYYDDFFYKFYDERYVDIDLITKINDGLKINTKALVELNGLTGVYVKDISNIIKFFPVEILGKNEEYTIVSEGDYLGEAERNTITIFEKKYSTIKAFDKVVIDPDRVYEGQIAN